MVKVTFRGKEFYDAWDDYAKTGVATYALVRWVIKKKAQDDPAAVALITEQIANICKAGPEEALKALQKENLQEKLQISALEITDNIIQMNKQPIIAATTETPEPPKP